VGLWFLCLCNIHFDFFFIMWFLILEGLSFYLLNLFYYANALVFYVISRFVILLLTTLFT